MAIALTGFLSDSHFVCSLIASSIALLLSWALESSKASSWGFGLCVYCFFEVSFMKDCTLHLFVVVLHLIIGLTCIDLGLDRSPLGRLAQDESLLVLKRHLHLLVLNLLDCKVLLLNC